MDLNSLPRPARSASNQEVRQGSREWPCHSWDAGSEFEPRRILLGAHRRVSRLTAAAAADSRDTSSKAPRFFRRRRRFGAFLVARSKKTRPPKGWSCFLWHAAGRGSKGYERSEKNVPGARFGARVRVAARQRRERASSPAGQGSKRSPARTACQFRWRR